MPIIQLSIALCLYAQRVASICAKSMAFLRVRVVNAAAHCNGTGASLNNVFDLFVVTQSLLCGTSAFLKAKLVGLHKIASKKKIFQSRTMVPVGSTLNSLYRQRVEMTDRPNVSVALLAIRAIARRDAVQRGKAGIQH